jgi:hypothetical protein
MPVFKDSAEMGEIMGGFFKNVSSRAAAGDPTMKGVHTALAKIDLIVKFVWKDPELTLMIDATTDPMGILLNDDSRVPVATFSLNGDTAHEFWHGKVNLAKALTTKKIVAKGPIPKILKLLPSLSPLYEAYPAYLKEIGRADLALS